MTRSHLSVVIKAAAKNTPENMICDCTLSNTQGIHPTNVTWENATAELRSLENGI